MNAKDESRESHGVDGDVSSIAGQHLRRLAAPRGAYLSDSALLERLRRRRGGLPSSRELKETVRARARIRVNSDYS